MIIEEAVIVSFVLDGTLRAFLVPKTDVFNGKNRYMYSSDFPSPEYFFISIYWYNNKWNFEYSTLNMFYSFLYINNTDSEYPYFDEWTFISSEFSPGDFLKELQTKKYYTKNTISYSKVSEGWNSFWSYNPDWMTEMNSSFYSFKDGNLWLHNSNQVRNNFYEEDGQSTIKTIFNEEPLMVKMFNTILLNSTHPWSSAINSNINDGYIKDYQFVEKEGQWYAYVRRIDNTIDIKQLSTQGIGTPVSVDSADPTDVIVVTPIDLSSLISVGDLIYKNDNGSLVLIGEVILLNPSEIHIDTTNDGQIPLITDFIICVKNSQAESFGVRGNYMDIELTNDLTEQSKLFAIGTSVFKSFL